MNTENSFAVRDKSPPERDNRWFSRTTTEQVEYRSDSVSRSPNIIRFPVTSTIVKQTSSYIPLPQTTTITHTALPLSTTIPSQIVVGQSTSLANSSTNIPASYIVGPATVTTSAPRELQGSFGTLPLAPLNMSSVRRDEVNTSIYRSGSVSNLQSTTNNYYQMQGGQRIGHEKCIQECRIWQNKFNQLQIRFVNLCNQKSRITMSQSQQISRLRQQKTRLEQRVFSLEQNQRRINENIQMYMTDIINRYRESTLKQSGLLFERFRLECRAMDKI